MVAPDAIHAVRADVYSPCALGGTLNEDTIPQLRCEIVVGAANNQLASPGDADRLAARGILHVPDYVANAGGVIDGARDICGWPPARSQRAVEAIYDTTLELLRAAEYTIETLVTGRPWPLEARFVRAMVAEGSSVNVIVRPR